MGLSFDDHDGIDQVEGGDKHFMTRTFMDIPSKFYHCLRVKAAYLPAVLKKHYPIDMDEPIS